MNLSEHQNELSHGSVPLTIERQQVENTFAALHPRSANKQSNILLANHVV